MGVQDTVLFVDIKEQVSSDTITALRQQRVLSLFGDNITAGTVSDVLDEAMKPTLATEVRDAAFMYDSQFTLGL